MSLRVKLTASQLEALRLIWLRLQEQPAPNCNQLAKVAKRPWGRMRNKLNRLAKKGVLVWRYGPRFQRLWLPGPMSDHLQEEGLLP